MSWQGSLCEVADCSKQSRSEHEKTLSQVIPSGDKQVVMTEECKRLKILMKVLITTLLPKYVNLEDRAVVWKEEGAGEPLRLLCGLLEANATSTEVLSFCRKEESKEKGCSLGAEGCKMICEALTRNTTLTELNMASNNIGDDGSKMIGELLMSNTTLQKVHMWSNNIKEGGAKAISAALRSNTTLTLLDVGDNPFSTEGIKSISAALEKNSVLTTLSLGGCRDIDGKVGAKELCEGLKKNTVLKTLYLHHVTSFGDDGAKALCEALKTNTSLTCLKMWDTNIGNELQERIREAIETRKGSVTFKTP